MSEIKDKLSAAKKEVSELKESIQGLKDKNNGGMGEQCLAAVAKESGDNAMKGGFKGRKKLRGHFGKVYAMHWAGDAERVVSASQDGKLIIWNAKMASKINAIPLRSSWVMTCAFDHADGSMVACGGLDNLCSIYKLQDQQLGMPGRATLELSGHDGYLSCCRFIDDSQMLTSSGDTTCMLWDMSTGEHTTIFKGHESDVMSLSLNPQDPNVFVSGSCDTFVKAWDIRSGECVGTYDGHESDINSVSFFPSGSGFGTGSDDSTCRIFDIRAYGEVNCFRNEKITCGITSTDFSKSGRLMFAGYDDNCARVWDSFSSTDGGASPTATLSSHENRVSCLGINHSKTSPDGSTALCTGSWDTFLWTWTP